MEEESLRKMAVEQYLQGKTPISIYQEMGRSKKWFFKWLHRYQSGDTLWYRERPRMPHSHPRQIHPDTHQLVTNIRIQLEQHPYAQVGTSAIKWEFKKLGITPPSDRTINRILKREGLVKKKLRILPKEWSTPISENLWGSTTSIRQTSSGHDTSKTMGASIRSMSWISTATESFFTLNEEKTTKPWLWA